MEKTQSNAAEVVELKENDTQGPILIAVLALSQFDDLPLGQQLSPARPCAQSKSRLQGGTSSSNLEDIRSWNFPLEAVVQNWFLKPIMNRKHLFKCLKKLL